MKQYLFFIFLSIFLFSCGSKTEEKSSKNYPVKKRERIEKKSKPVKKIEKFTSYFDSTELKAFWESRIIPIIHLDKEAISSFVNFPLPGEWGSYAGLDKPRDQLTENDFWNNLEKVFYPEMMSKLQAMSFNDLLIHEYENGNKQICVSFYFEHEYDGFVDEETIMLQFDFLENEWKLTGIYGAS